MDAEKKVFGFNSYSVSKTLFTAWNFPEPLSDLHQMEDNKPGLGSKEIAVVALAKLLSRDWGYPGCYHLTREIDKERLLKYLEISSHDLSSWEPGLRKDAMLAANDSKGINT